MTMMANIAYIQTATCRTGVHFDVVQINCQHGGSVELLLPVGRGQAVADAISAAVQPKADEVAA